MLLVVLLPGGWGSDGQVGCDLLLADILPRGSDDSVTSDLRWWSTPCWLSSCWVGWGFSRYGTCCLLSSYRGGGELDDSMISVSGWDATCCLFSSSSTSTLCTDTQTSMIALRGIRKSWAEKKFSDSDQRNTFPYFLRLLSFLNNTK